jgi:hypothetical protein
LGERQISTQSEIDDGDVWARLGIAELLSLPPAEWLEVSPVAFVVGVHKHLTGFWPTLSATIGMLEVIAHTTVTPARFISTLASQFNNTGSEVQVLLQSYPKRSSWLIKLKSPVPKFNRSQIVQSIMVLRLTHHQDRLDWGGVVFEMIYKSSAALQGVE